MPLGFGAVQQPQLCLALAAILKEATLAVLLPEEPCLGTRDVYLDLLMQH